MHNSNHALKDFLFDKMYYHYRIMRMSKRAERFIRALFASYVSEPRQLPIRLSYLSRPAIASSGRGRLYCRYD